MKIYKHSVSLEESKCKGCTHCLTRCPTEAIRIRDTKAAIDPNKCIDCGECIRLCPYKAKRTTHDSLDRLNEFKYRIALPAPALYGQFDNLDDIDQVLDGLFRLGFDDVFEVAKAAELVSGYTRMYLKQNHKKPVISSACPVVVRLITMRYPLLCDNIMKLLPPAEIAGQLAREKAKNEHPELKDNEIGVFFISPCPAKVSYFRNVEEGKGSSIDSVLSMRDIYFKLIDCMSRDTIPKASTESGMVGIGWASSGGESSALFNERYLAADGIENVISVLDQIDNSDIPELEFVELNACVGGCVGGAMTVANPFIAKARLQNLKRYLPVSHNRIEESDGIPDFARMIDVPEYIPTNMLSEDRAEAMRMMSEIQQLQKDLPDLDCGSCGAPTCAAFAEDIIKGENCIDECTVIMRMLFHESLSRRYNSSKYKQPANREAFSGSGNNDKYICKKTEAEDET